jgi:protein TonB
LGAAALERDLDYAEQKFSSRQAAGIAFVVLLHVAIIYALLSGLGAQVVQVLHTPLQAKIITPPKLLPPQPPPPPPPPLLAPPPPFIPPPLVQIAQPPPPPVIRTVTRVRPRTPPPAPLVVPPPPRPAPVVMRTAPSLDPDQTCTPPQYPEAAEDMEETGISVLQFLIGTDGRVLDSRVASSSGHAALDEAAVAALSQCKFRPAEGSDGQPQEAWTSIRYVWQLN